MSLGLTLAKPLKQKLVMTFDEAVTARYLAEAARRTQAEVEAECMPSGASLRADLCTPLRDFLSMRIGNDWCRIREVEVELWTVE